MTVYLAICDTNIADRKQLERLLTREKDRRLAENGDVLYIESFGSEEALLATPVKYDMFFADLTDENTNGMDTAKKLRLSGITAPVVLCSSSVDYRSYGNTPDNIICIDKPVNAGQISHLVDVATQFSGSKIRPLEVRCQKETYFIKPEELIKAVPIDSFLTRLSLTDGRIIDMSDSIDSFYKQCRLHGCFIRCKKDIVNICHITSAAKNGFTLSNGDSVHYGILQKNEILGIMSQNMRFLQSH